MLDELEHRNTPKALALKREVEDWLNKGGKGAAHRVSSSERQPSQNRTVKETTGFVNASGSAEKPNMVMEVPEPASEKPRLQC